jgi:hypothetical protein
MQQFVQLAHIHVLPVTSEPSVRNALIIIPEIQSKIVPALTDFTIQVVLSVLLALLFVQHAQMEHLVLLASPKTIELSLMDSVFVLLASIKLLTLMDHSLAHNVLLNVPIVIFYQPSAQIVTHLLSEFSALMPQAIKSATAGLDTLKMVLETVSNQLARIMQIVQPVLQSYQSQPALDVLLQPTES